MSVREVGVMYPARQFPPGQPFFRLPRPAWFPPDAKANRSYDDPARSCRVRVYRSTSFPLRGEFSPVCLVPYDCPSRPELWDAESADDWIPITEDQEPGWEWKAPAVAVRLAKAEAALKQIRDFNPMLYAAKGETMQAWRDIAAAFDKIARAYFDEVTP